MKIKTKKQLSLPQLIEYAWDNGIKNKHYVSKNRYIVTFDKIGFLESSTLPLDEIFTVEAEEEITEDTVIPKLMTTFKKTYLQDDFGYQRVRIDENYPIKRMLNRAEAHEEPIETLHVVNDDGTHTLIWRDGKLIKE